MPSPFSAKTSRDLLPRPLAIIYGLLLFTLLGAAGCTILPENSLSLSQRSTVIRNDETVKQVLSKAVLEESGDPAVNHIRVLHLQGTPYEMGFQHGRLLKREVRDAVYHVLRKVGILVPLDTLDEVWDLMAPYIPVEEKEEMRGLAHGAGIPLRLVHWVHALPELSEYRGRKQFRHRLSGTSCSNLAAFGQATAGRAFLQLRVLDWNRELGTHKWPVILVHRPDKGNASVTFSFAGFIGAVSGMNDRHMAFGEKGEGNKAAETLEGTPFVFLFRKLMREAGTLDRAVEMIREAKRTCAYSFLISDAKSGTTKAVLIFSDKDKIKIYEPGRSFTDPRDRKEYPGLKDVVYNGADKKDLFRAITSAYGRIDTEALKEIAVKVARKSNIQNVIFNPVTLESWVSHAATPVRDEKGRAANQAWFYFNFKDALQ